MTQIKTPFGFHSTASEVASGIDLTGKRAIVTGGASGIGVETARALAQTGAEVTLAVRNIEAGNKTADDIIATTGNKNVFVAQLELLDRNSIDAFVDTWSGPLHILVNNAGVMAIPELKKTPDGWETQFATNHLGHFALTLGLYDALVDAGTARIVVVSSSAHQRSPVIFDDVNFNFRPYDQWNAYGQSKTANVLFAVATSERWANDGITANALMPGAIPTNLQRYVGGVSTRPEMRKTTQEGASTSVLLAVSPLLDGIGGRYFDNCNESDIITSRSPDMTGVAPYALDKANADRLWDLSLKALAL
jgi:NAD(P)-dependent dehydrogenase (short-subunit alcohol dehydrogenase family)